MDKKYKIFATVGAVTSGVFALIGGSKIYEKHKYNENGYDKHGFNKYGYDKNGFNRDGYDQDGYNINGFDYFGFNKYGYNQDGLDHSGNSFSTYAEIANELTTNHTNIQKYISEKQFEDARFLLSKSFNLFYTNLCLHAGLDPDHNYGWYEEIARVYCNSHTRFSSNEYNEIIHADNLINANYKLASNQFEFANRILGKLPDILLTKVTDYSQSTPN